MEGRMFGCRHKYGEVKEGYQYCAKCGKAIAAPKRECEHNWIEMDKYGAGSVFNNNIHTYIYMMRCTKCGETKKISTRSA
jgi:uncharacterized OB-fold protein